MSIRFLASSWEIWHTSCTLGTVELRGESVHELHLQLDNILEEAINQNFDQLVVVSRSDESHLYLLSKGRVKKGITFESDIAGAITQYFATKQSSEQLQEQLQYEMDVTAAAGLGKCFSVKIHKK